MELKQPDIMLALAQPGFFRAESVFLPTSQGKEHLIEVNEDIGLYFNDCPAKEDKGSLKNNAGFGTFFLGLNKSPQKIE